jgi:hypothetical protein
MDHHSWVSIVCSDTKCLQMEPMPDLPLCLCVLKHRASLARGPHLPAKNIITMDFCLCGAILNLKAFCFGAIPDIMIELIAYCSKLHHVSMNPSATFCLPMTRGP